MAPSCFSAGWLAVLGSSLSDCFFRQLHPPCADTPFLKVLFQSYSMPLPKRKDGALLIIEGFRAILSSIY